MKKYILFIAFFPLLFSCSGDKTDKATGTFEATEVTVSAQANGQLIDWDLNEGDSLAIGQQIGSIDSVQLFYKKQQLTAQMKSVDARKPNIAKQIAVIKEQLRIAKAEKQRMVNLVKANAGNQKSVDDWNHQISVLKRQLDAQYSSLNKRNSGVSAESEALTFQLLQLQDQLSKCSVKAPIHGVVLAKYVEQGEFVAVGKPMFKMADLDVLFLRAYVTTDQLYNLKLNQTLQVDLDNGNTYEGRLIWISSKAEFTPKGIQTKDERENLVYAIKVAVKNDGYLKVGQYGEVEL